MSYNLTKSKITTGLHCPKKLWFDINDKIKIDADKLWYLDDVEKRLRKFMAQGLIYQIILKKIYSVNSRCDE